MHKIARRIIETYLKEKKILTVEELGLSWHEHETSKNLVFVTLYKNGSIIASSGRIHLKKPNTLFELIENTLFCLRDPRFVVAVKNPDELTQVHIRVDMIRPEDRRILQKISDLDIKREGLILLSQTKNSIGVLLPSITNVASTPDEYFQIVCKKAGLISWDMKPEDMVLYAIASTIFSDL